MMRARKDRIALNEALFRKGNERMSSWPERQEAPPSAKLTFLCECADVECRQHVYMTMPAYEAVRADPMRFVVVSGHELASTEAVVERHEGYVVVEKHEEVRDITERTDPRRGG